MENRNDAYFFRILTSYSFAHTNYHYCLCHRRGGRSEKSSSRKAWFNRAWSNATENERFRPSDFNIDYPRPRLDKVNGLEVGAGDYITKVFSLNELSARVRVHSGRVTHEISTIENYAFRRWRRGFQKCKAIRNGLPIELSSRKFELLKFLVNYRCETARREQLLDAIWDYDAIMFTITIDNHVAKLRQ